MQVLAIVLGCVSLAVFSMLLVWGVGAWLTSRPWDKEIDR